MRVETSGSVGVAQSTAPRHDQSASWSQLAATQSSMARAKLAPCGCAFTQVSRQSTSLVPQAAWQTSSKPHARLRAQSSAGAQHARPHSWQPTTGIPAPPHSSSQASAQEVALHTRRSTASSLSLPSPAQPGSSPHASSSSQHASERQAEQLSLPGALAPQVRGGSRSSTPASCRQPNTP